MAMLPIGITLKRVLITNVAPKALKAFGTQAV